MVSIHFAANPDVGGNLLKLDTNNSDIDLMDFDLFSVLVCFSISIIINITAVQYKIENTSNVTILSCLLIINHLLLKTEESARISKVFFLFNSSMGVNTTHVIINHHMVEFRVIDKINSGIDFCQVIRIIDFM